MTLNGRIRVFKRSELVGKVVARTSQPADYLGVPAKQAQLAARCLRCTAARRFPNTFLKVPHDFAIRWLQGDAAKSRLDRSALYWGKAGGMFRPRSWRFGPTSEENTVGLALPGKRLLFLVCSLCWLLMGCRTMPPWPVTDFSEPGWQVSQGQAIWRPERDSFEIAGELLFARHPNGCSFLQFATTSIPMVVAQTTTNDWQIKFIPRNRVLRGKGKASGRFVWFQLAPALAGTSLPSPWRIGWIDADRWRLENTRTGESLEGYLNP